MAEQKKGTPILMKFFSDAFAAHLRTVSVNYTLHQYKVSIAPSGESDTELLENAIRAIGNAKPAVQNSLMSTQQIMREPNLPQQMVADFDLHAQWCQSTLEELDLCDATIRNAIMSKDDYLAILSQALSPYYDAMGIPSDFDYPGQAESTDDPDEDEPEDIPEDDDDDDPDAPIIITEGIEPEPVREDPERDALMDEVEELRNIVAMLMQQFGPVPQPDTDVEEGEVEGPFAVEAPERSVAGTSGPVEEIYELTNEGLVGQGIIPEPEPLVAPVTEGPVVESEPVRTPVRRNVRRSFESFDLPTLEPRNRTGMMVEPESIHEEPVMELPTPVFEPTPTVDEPKVTEPVIEEPTTPAYTEDELVEAARRIIEENHARGEEPAPIDPYHQPAAPESDYAGLFGYDQYDEPDQPQPLAEDPVRLSQIAEKASEVITAARKKSGRAATKSTGTSAKGKGKTSAKTGTRKTASKSTGRTTKPRKKATDAPVTTPVESEPTEQTDSQTPSQQDNNDNMEDTQ